MESTTLRLVNEVSRIKGSVLCERPRQPRWAQGVQSQADCLAHLALCYASCTHYLMSHEALSVVAEVLTWQSYDLLSGRPTSEGGE